jgi:hypothetical protein
MKLFAETAAQFQTRLSQEEVLKQLSEYAQSKGKPVGPLQNYKAKVEGQKFVLEQKMVSRAIFLTKDSWRSRAASDRSESKQG